jgi:hypothetical protein
MSAAFTLEFFWPWPAEVPLCALLLTATYDALPPPPLSPDPGISAGGAGQKKNNGFHCCQCCCATLFLFAVFRTLPLIDAYQSKKTELPKTMERSAVQPSTGQSLQFAKVG